MRSPECCIGGGVVRVQVDRALKERGRLVVLVAARVRQELAAAQHVFVGREVVGGLREDAFPLEPGELHGSRADHASGDVVLHGENVLELGIIGFGPDMNAGPGLGQFDIDAKAIADAADAASEEITRIEQAPDLGRRKHSNP